MKIHGFLLLTLLFILISSCEEPTIPLDNCLTMTLDEDFSDALPIQMWINGKDSFNVGSDAYVKDICFHQNHKCSSELKLLFKVPVNVDLALQIINELGVEAYNQLFEKEDVYVTEEIDNREFNENFDVSISPYSNGAIAPYSATDGVAWQWFDGGSEQWVQAVRVAESDERTLTLLAERPESSRFFPLGEYVITVRVKNNSNLISGSGDAIGLAILAVRENGTVEVLGNIATIDNDNTWVIRTENVTATEKFKYIGFVASQEGGGGTFNIGAYINYIEITLPETEDIYNHTIYEKAIIPSDEGMCDGKYQLKILHRAGDIPSLEEWLALEGTWVIDADPSTSIAAGQTSSMYKYGINGKFIPGLYSIKYDIDLTGGSNSELTIDFKKDSVSVGSATTGILTSGNFTANLAITLTDEPDEIIVSLENLGGGGKTMVVNEISKVTGPDAIEKAYSDYVNFVAALSDILIQYRSFSPFASIPYENDSTYFNFFIPAQFSSKMERSPSTIKTIPLTQKTLATASGLKKQRPIRTVESGIPSYILNKFNLIMQHAVSGEVVSDGYKWLMEGEMEQVDQRPETFPLHQYEAWLTKRDYIKENII